MARYMIDEAELAIIRARCEGTSVVVRLDEQDVIDHPENRDWLLERAREEHGSDEIEVDDDAQLSPDEVNYAGCWVQGWLWVGGC